MLHLNTPPPDPVERPPAEEAPVGYAEIKRFALQHGRFVLATSLGAGLITVVIGLVVPRSYEAVATVAVVPLRFGSELRPDVLSVQAYQQILQSDNVVARTADRLVEGGWLAEKSEPPRIGSELESRIFVSRRSEETTLAPLIEVVARAESGTKAAAIANLWTGTFLEFTNEIGASSLDATISVIEKEYQSARVELTRLENQRQARIIAFEEQIDETQVRWDRELVSFKKDTEDYVGDFQNETRRILQQFAVDQALLSMDSQRETGVEPEGGARLDHRDIPSETRQQLAEILSLRIRLAQTPQILVLEKAVSDDALWQAISLNQGRPQDLRPLTERSLLSQELNPVHSELATRLAHVEVDTEDLPDPLRARIQSSLEGLEVLQRRRSGGLAKLLTDRALSFDLLKLKKRQEIGTLERDRTLALERINRDLKSQQELFSKLAASNNEARLARAGQVLEEVRLTSPAVEPQQARSRQLPLKTILATVLGFLLGCIGAFVREMVSVEAGPGAARSG